MESSLFPDDPGTNAITRPIGVIIPTYNRSNALITCLEHLERQTFSNFEVVVVDDGSTDETLTLLAEFQRRTCLHFRYLSQKNGGPARARNAAIASLKAPICLMIGDDIFASPRLVETHLQLHQSKPALEVAGLGLTSWSESGQTVTRFMRWLDESGMQFAYHDLLRGTHPDWKHFYTSNLSLKTDLLRAFPFDENFVKAATEDIELGFRIEMRRGLELVFLPAAIAYHLHPTSFRQACKRMIGVGSSTRLFHDIWPIQKPPTKNKLSLMIRDALFGSPWLLPPLTFIADHLTQVWCPNPLMRFVLDFHRGLGYRDGQASAQRRHPS
jgi:glycosyltransferase involved in cell wall biosynthesis